MICFEPGPSALWSRSSHLLAVSTTRLFPFIEGELLPGEASHLDAAYGNALAELDAALARIELPPPPSLHPPFGDLYQVHPAIPDPLDAVQRLPIEAGKQRTVARIIRELLTTTPALYDALPRQIVHRDLDGTNVLIDRGRVHALLDFEFAGPDLRIVDLAVALNGFVAAINEGAEGWQRVRTLGLGYGQRLELSRAEIGALPLVIRLYRAVSLIYRAGRLRQGTASEAGVRARIEALLRVNTWLERHAAELTTALSPVVEG